ncbi:uncharacterized protein [Amphiura filiformis]|uniref:uncharacterized protein n=1 Tax=Amphiura filiformis TaxID=82378 RepID=UPI003B20D4D3
MVLGFPILSLLYLYLPFQKVKQLVGCPYSKFVLKFASDLFFIILLTVDTTMKSELSTELAIQSPTKALLLIWIIGIAWREFRVVYRQGPSALKQSSHWRDMLLVLLFVLGIAFDTASFFVYNNNETSDDTSEVRRDTYFMYSQPYKSSDSRLPAIQSGIQFGAEHAAIDSPILHRMARATKIIKGQVDGDDASQGLNFIDQQFTKFIAYEWWHPKLLATAMFAMSTVISFLRMLQYAVVSDVIGPFQISLGSMVSKTANFFVVVGVVLFSFAVGLTYMYSYYDKVQSLSCGRTSGVECVDSKFSNLFFGFMYLFWSALGFQDQGALALSNQAVVIETAGVLLYAAFYVLMVIVLLNALIAVMSKTYHSVEGNADVEWKFHSTVMWMSILFDDDVIPPPFNLLPSIDSIKKLLSRCRRWGKKCRHGDDDKIQEMENQIKQKHADKSQYKVKLINIDTAVDRASASVTMIAAICRVINKLVERYVTDKTKDGKSPNAEVNITDILGLKNDLQSLKLEMFQRLIETNHLINTTTVDGYTIQDTSTKAKIVLNKTGDIHDYADTVLKSTVLDFKTSVLTRKNKVLKDDGLFSSLFRKDSTKSRIGDRRHSSVGTNNSAKVAPVKRNSLESKNFSDQGLLINRASSLLNVGSSSESEQSFNEKSGKKNEGLEFITVDGNISTTKTAVQERGEMGDLLDDSSEGPPMAQVNDQKRNDTGFFSRFKSAKETNKNSTSCVENVILNESTQSGIENGTVKQSDKFSKNIPHTDTDESILSVAKASFEENGQTVDTSDGAMQHSDKESTIETHADKSILSVAEIQNNTGIFTKLFGSSESPKFTFEENGQTEDAPNGDLQQSDKPSKIETHTDKSILSAAETENTTGIFTKLFGSSESQKASFEENGQTVDTSDGAMQHSDKASTIETHTDKSILSVAGTQNTTGIFTKLFSSSESQETSFEENGQTVDTSDGAMQHRDKASKIEAHTDKSILSAAETQNKTGIFTKLFSSSESPKVTFEENGQTEDTPNGDLHQSDKLSKIETHTDKSNLSAAETENTTGIFTKLFGSSESQKALSEENGQTVDTSDGAMQHRDKASKIETHTDKGIMSAADTQNNTGIFTKLFGPYESQKALSEENGQTVDTSDGAMQHSDKASKIKTHTDKFLLSGAETQNNIGIFTKLFGSSESQEASFEENGQTVDTSDRAMQHRDKAPKIETHTDKGILSAAEIQNNTGIFTKLFGSSESQEASFEENGQTVDTSDGDLKQSDKPSKIETHTDKSILSAADTENITGIFTKLFGSSDSQKACFEENGQTVDTSDGAMQHSDKESTIETHTDKSILSVAETQNTTGMFTKLFGSSESHKALDTSDGDLKQSDKPSKIETHTDKSVLSATETENTTGIFTKLFASSESQKAPFEENGQTVDTSDGAMQHRDKASKIETHTDTFILSAADTQNNTGIFTKLFGSSESQETSFEEKGQTIDTSDGAMQHRDKASEIETHTNRGILSADETQNKTGIFTKLFGSSESTTITFEENGQREDRSNGALRSEKPSKIERHTDKSILSAAETENTTGIFTQLFGSSESQNASFEENGHTVDKSDGTMQHSDKESTIETHTDKSILSAAETGNTNGIFTKPFGKYEAPKASLEENEQMIDKLNDGTKQHDFPETSSISSWEDHLKDGGNEYTGAVDNQNKDSSVLSKLFGSKRKETTEISYLLQ